MKDPLPFELLIVRSLYSIAQALAIYPRVNRIIDPTIKELTAFEANYWKENK